MVLTKDSKGLLSLTHFFPRPFLKIFFQRCYFFTISSGNTAVVEIIVATSQRDATSARFYAAATNKQWSRVIKIISNIF